MWTRLEKLINNFNVFQPYFVEKSSSAVQSNTQNYKMHEMI